MTDCARGSSWLTLPADPFVLPADFFRAFPDYQVDKLDATLDDAQESWVLHAIAVEYALATKARS